MLSTLKSSNKRCINDDFPNLRREISVLQGFLGSKTSLVSGIREIEAKRISTFESGNWGKTSRYTGKARREIKFASTKEFYDFLSSKTFQGLKNSGYTSEQLVEIYDEARESEEADEVLEKMEEALEGRSFARCNKGYLVNLEHVDGIQDGCAMVRGDKLLISRGRRGPFLDALADYVGGISG